MTRTTTTTSRAAGLSPTVLLLAAFVLAGGGLWILTSTHGYDEAHQPAAASTTAHPHPTPAVASPARPSTRVESAAPTAGPSTSQTAHPSSRPPVPPTREIDPLAGPLTDPQLQQLMEGTYPCAIRSAAAVQAIAVAWTGLQGDLLVGGWTEVRKQAGIACPSTSPAAEPGELQVTIMWSGSRPVTGPIDRQLGAVLVVPHGDSWQVQSLL